MVSRSLEFRVLVVGGDGWLGCQGSDFGFRVRLPQSGCSRVSELIMLGLKAGLLHTEALTSVCTSLLMGL